MSQEIAQAQIELTQEQLDRVPDPGTLARAQVHATLAVAEAFLALDVTLGEWLPSIESAIAIGAPGSAVPPAPGGSRRPGSGRRSPTGPACPTTSTTTASAAWGGPRDRPSDIRRG